MGRRAMRAAVAVVACAWMWGGAAPAHATERLCDTAFEDCRTPLLNLINSETVGLDVAFWFMQDTRYEAAILKRWKAGVPVRVLVDPKANPTYDGNQQVLNDLAAAGIPMRYRLPTAPGILHWKVMLFAGQNQVMFSGANFSPTAFVPQAPYSDYEDETPYFSDDPSIVNSFKTKYDDLWLDTKYYGNYANITNPPARIYPIYTKDPALNFPQQEDYAARILKRYSAETQKIDVIMYRVTDERHTNAMISAMQRGVPVRIISDMYEYRNPARQWVSYNLDRMWTAGVPIKVRAHAGLNHQKLVIMYNQAMAVFGSSNWTSASANQQQEHNYFTTKPWMFQWFVDLFERKWNNLAPNGAMETDWFTPLAPDKPIYLSPADGSVGQPLSMALRWDGGPWAHIYDVYFGTDPNPPLYASNLHLGPTDVDTPTVTQMVPLPLLQHGTTYYWRVVSKTMAGMQAKGATASFTTSGTPPPPAPPANGASTIVMWSSTDVPPSSVFGNWQWMNDSTAAGGKALWNPDRGQAKVSPPLAVPTNYFETTFDAMAGVGYHLWLRMKAQANSNTSNSVSVQFDDAIDRYGSPLYPIGSAQGAEMILADPSGAISGWGWEDNGPTLVYFSSTGQHRIRIQQRADGAIVDQIVLSPDAFLTTPPGATTNDRTIYGSTIDGAQPPAPASPIPPLPPPLPPAWQQQDIGATPLPGYGEFGSTAEAFTIAGAGADIWGTADAFHYVYLPLNGDGTITARVTGVTNTNVWAKAGVMIRESTAPGSAHAFMLMSAAKGTSFIRRQAAAATSVSLTGTATLVSPYWVRLDRAGNTFTAYQSADGTTWKKVGTDTIVMASSALIGLAVTSHATDASSVATFDKVAINGVPVSGTCAPAVSPGSISVSSDATSTSVSVTAGSQCSWTAESTVPWLAVTSGSSGTGPGTVTIGVDANADASRTGAVTIAGQTFSISQASPPCSDTISPTGQATTVDGGALAVTVAAAGYCSWTATSNDSWITVTGGASGSGDGSVSLSVAANNGGDRVGSLTIAGQTFTVSQVGAPCTFTVSPAGQSVGGGASPASFTVSTASYCSWAASTNDPWLSVSSGSSGTGSGTVTLTAAANSGPARTGSGTIAGQTVTVSQDAASCAAAISPAAQTVSADGGATTTTLAIGSWCSWTAASNAAWITLTSAASGSGSATVSVSTAANVGPARSGTITVAGQTFTVSQAAPGLPAGWTNQDIGAVGAVGSAGFDGTTFSIAGAGADVWGTSDAFQYVYQPLTGDGRIVARVVTVQNSNAWVKAGVMIRETTDPGSAQAFMLESYSKGLAFQRRPATNGASVSTTGATTAAPYWVRLDRTGDTFIAYQSPDGVMWTIVGTETIPMAPTVLVGLAVSSHSTAAAATATFDNVSVVSGAPPPWTHKDIGAVGPAGTATYTPSTGVFMVKGAGSDIWGTADAFHYAYQTMSGDGAIVARVASVQNINAWTKAGVMIRETLDPGSANALMLVSWSKGLSFQRRQTAGGASVSTPGALVGAPYWVKLERVGTTFNAYSSPDGISWTLVGSDTVAMGTNVYVGLAVSSHSSSAAAQATFDGVVRQ